MPHHRVNRKTDEFNMSLGQVPGSTPWPGKRSPRCPACHAVIWTTPDGPTRHDPYAPKPFHWFPSCRWRCQVCGFRGAISQFLVGGKP